MLKFTLGFLDRPTYAVIAARRGATDLDERRDILSLLLQARTEDGEALTDHELRDELLSLVLAGHETTANTLAWAWERLVRTPDAKARLVEAVRSGDEEAGDEAIESVIVEAMRSRPVIPIIGRRVKVAVADGRLRPAGRDAVLISILLASPPRGPLSRPLCIPPRALDRRASRAPTSGSPSAAASAAASAPPWRWPSSAPSCGRSRCASTSRPTGPSPSTRFTAT